MSDMAINIAVQPGFKAFAWAGLLMFVLPVLITAVAVLLGARSLAPGALAGVAVTGLLLFAGMAWWMWRTEIVLADDYLRISAGLYAKQVPRSVIDWQNSHRVDLSRWPEFKPALRTNGIGLPGYQVGSFRLNNGARAFLVLTGEPIVYVALQRGEGLLLSVEAGSALFRELGEAQGGASP